MGRVWCCSDRQPSVELENVGIDAAYMVGMDVDKVVRHDSNGLDVGSRSLW